jgi:hypothetical protein
MNLVRDFARLGGVAPRATPGTPIEIPSAGVGSPAAND